MTRRDFTAHPYQKLIIEHILQHPRCAVWAGMGMGKTSSTLTALDILSLAEPVGQTLVLAPLRVARTTWPEETRKWRHLSGLDVMPIVGSEAERRAALRFDAPIFACNYDNLPWLVDYFGERWPFATVIADEATRLKSFRLRQGGKRAQALARVAHTKVKRFIELTGTPSPNGLADLWGQIWFLDAGQRLGRTWSAFTERWFKPSADGYGTTALPFAQAEIQDRIRDLCITIDPADWFDLDEPIVRDIYVELPVRARRHYDELEREMFTELEGHELEAFSAAARTIKCLQLANGAAYVDDKGSWREVHDEKLQALESIVTEAAGAPVLVAYHFKSDLARLAKAFPQGRVLDANPQTITEWNAGKIPVLFAHPASAGHGLNLQDGGHHLVYFGHWWNLEERMQILERIGPMRQQQAGHRRPVHVYNIVARDTVDELVISRVESKREVQDLLLDYMKRKA